MEAKTANANTELDLYTAKGLFVQTPRTLQGGGTQLTVTVGKAKDIAHAFNLDKAGTALKREEAGLALKTVAVMTLGAAANNPNITCASIRTTHKKNGNIRRTIALEEQTRKSASEEMIAAYFGGKFTVEEIRKMRSEAVKSATTVDSSTQVAA